MKPVDDPRLTGRQDAPVPAAELWLDQQAEDAAAAERERARRIGEGEDEFQPLPEVLTVEQMLERFVYIESTMQVVAVDQPARALAFHAFKSAFKASKSPTGHSNAAAWLEHPKRQRAHTVTFKPGAPTFTRDPQGLEALNTWRRRPLDPPADWRERVQPLLLHVEYLVPVADERERFLSWLAHIEQKPGELPHHHHLLVALQTGIGRNWLSGCFARVWAGNVATSVSLHADLLGSFNGRLSRKLLAVVDELHEGAASRAMSYRVRDELKSTLTADVRSINHKYGAKVEEFNCCRFLMFSNRDAALPLDENDRRIVVIRNPEQRHPVDYYTRLYGLLNDPLFIASVRQWLAVRDISGFRPGEPAPMSEAKRQMIEASMSDLQLAARDIATSWPSDCVRARQILQEADIAPTDRAAGKQLQAVAQAAGMRRYSKKVKLGTDAGAVYIVRNFDRWANALPAAVAAEVRAGESRRE